MTLIIYLLCRLRNSLLLTKPQVCGGQYVAISHVLINGQSIAVVIENIVLKLFPSNFK